MQDNSEAVHRLHEEIISTTDFINIVVRSLTHRHRTQQLSGRGLTEVLEQLDQSEEDGGNTTHRALDIVEAVATDVGDILQELKVLKKALPATYFKNRSRVKVAFEQMELKAGESQRNAFSIMEVLQYQDVASQGTEQTGELLESLKAKLLSISESLNAVREEKEEPAGSTS